MLAMPLQIWKFFVHFVDISRILKMALYFLRHYTIIIYIYKSKCTVTIKACGRKEISYEEDKKYQLLVAG